MKKSIREDVFIKQPVYEGGNKAMTVFIQKILKYPVDALESKTEGVVEVRITIDFVGNVISSQILGSLSSSCDTEAKRVAELLKFTIPKNPRNLKVLFHKIIKVQFNLPKVQAQKMIPPTTQKITYNIVSESKSTENVSITPAATTYQYTIKINK
jgi:protein TonB